jgi:hypothetical protein
MRTLVDERLRAEALTYDLRYACEHCAHFDAERGSCAEGYPNEGHRETRIEKASSLEFCKSFELGGGEAPARENIFGLGRTDHDAPVRPKAT